MEILRRFAKHCSRAAAVLVRDRRAATAIEYGLIAALIVIAMIASFQLVASVTVGMWGNINARVTNAAGS